VIWWERARRKSAASASTFLKGRAVRLPELAIAVSPAHPRFLRASGVRIEIQIQDDSERLLDGIKGQKYCLQWAVQHLRSIKAVR